ncbi:hypothetical protein [Streptomyces resistomycificus]|uniref:Uncharacterized protein n=1 Tax=Streptomyces resistomycificus TaxID=67356 RepID=A0A0L8L022_9ACTN|nr:hypothetical protein [Streptomyces resistomycificus]KOG31537.1 hypothetical protein ADK37_30560 [Streptomyces resistomycificus]KUN93033.1 hypothetical protein AQJ84_31025 [Streptomyces resistomycificus]
MTQSAPPPQPADGNPYAQQPDAAPQPTGGNPYAQQPGTVPPPAGAFAPAPPAPARGNTGIGGMAVGLAVAIVVALVTAGVYGAIVGATEYEIGYAAVGVGFLIGFAAGKLGGSSPVLPVVSALLSLGAVYAGQLLGIAMIAADESGMTVTTILTDYFDLVTEVWSEEADVMTFLFLGIGGFAAFSAAKKSAA